MDVGHCAGEGVFVALLKTCAKQKNLLKGSRLHAEAGDRVLLQRSSYVASALVSMYAKCGAFGQARQILHDLPAPNVVSWNALIAGYAHQGKGQEALSCIKQMQCEGLTPNAATFSCALRACGSLGAFDIGERIHEEIVKQGLLEENVVLCTALLDMYVKCGALEKAQGVLVELPVRDIYMWNVLIAGYVNHSRAEKALSSINQLQHEGLFPDAVSFVCALRACGIIGAAHKGEQIHQLILKQPLMENNVVLGNALVGMYAKCGVFEKAQRVLHGLLVRDVVSWNALITGYIEQGKAEEALSCIDRMQCEGLCPDAITFTCALQACASIEAVDKGEHFHSEIHKQQLLENHVVGNALVDMYAKCGDLQKAQEVLFDLPIRNIVSWTALMAGFAQQGKAEEALNCIGRMQCDGVFPDAITFACALRACVSAGATDKGKQIHEEIVKERLLGKNIFLGNALVDMYAKCGMLEKAQQLLYEISTPDVVSWNALIAGYVQCGKAGEALSCLNSMQDKGIFPDAVTFASILRSCTITGALDKGEQIHAQLIELQLLEIDVVLGNTLVDMYAKCGASDKACQVLYKLPVRDVVSWNAVVSAFTQQGESKEVMTCFIQMQHESHSPNEITFLCVLNSCSHSGLLATGHSCFEKMSTNYGITPGIEHQCCLVDLFGRAGEFDKALAMIKSMPSCEDVLLWLTLLGACWKWKNVLVGRLAFERATQIDEYEASAYVLMHNIYISLGMQEDAKNIEDIQVRNKAWNISIYSKWAGHYW